MSVTDLNFYRIFFLKLGYFYPPPHRRFTVLSGTVKIMIFYFACKLICESATVTYPSSHFYNIKSPTFYSIFSTWIFLTRSN